MHPQHTIRSDDGRPTCPEPPPAGSMGHPVEQAAGAPAAIEEGLSIAQAHELPVEFTVVLERNPQTGVWVAEVPGLPGCYTQGGSRDEVLANIREVLELLKQTQELSPPRHVEFTQVRIEA